MALFGGTKTKAEDTTIWEKQVYDLARKAEEETLLKSHSAYLDMMAAHNLDSGSYSFECRRWGDFLALFITRGGQKYAGAINLSQTKEIKLTAGHMPDFNGVMIFRVKQEPDNDTSGAIVPGGVIYVGGSGSDYFDYKKPPTKGYHYAVTARFPLARGNKRPIIYVEMPQRSTSQSAMHGGGGAGYPSIPFYDRGNYFGIESEGVPRDSEDDIINFVGIDTTLFVPVGRGDEVRDIILKEIANGFSPKKDSVLTPHTK